MAEDDSIKPRSGDNTDGSGLERIEDGSVVSNIHTSKWRVFTDSGREHFFQVLIDDLHNETQNCFFLCL